jgi:energy-coupling factor transporter ATP-binding protein EcfA2
VDIGAIEYIHKRIIQLRDEGKAVLLVSVELDEIRSMSDRILVMFAGRVVGERGPGASERELGLLMAGVGQDAGSGALDDGVDLRVLESSDALPVGVVSGAEHADRGCCRDQQLRPGLTASPQRDGLEGARR